jgi:hypothetical protein
MAGAASAVTVAPQSIPRLLLLLLLPDQMEGQMEDEMLLPVA